jgi:adenylate cyclase
MDRKLTTILVADLVDYSRMMAVDEERVIARLRAVRAGIVDPEIELSGGRIIKSMGDGLLVDFPSPVAAVRCALLIQERMAELEVRPGDLAMQYRMGLHLGDIVIDGDDILGDAVNIAARLEGLAPSGGICLSGTVYDQVRGKITGTLTALGAQKVKNIPDPVNVWTLEIETGSARPLPSRVLQDEAPPSVVVMPFTEIGLLDDDFLCDGIVEEITSAQSCVRDFTVIARQSAFAFRRRDVDVREVGRLLGARYVLTGSVRRSGARLRVAVQLSDAQSGGQIMSERYDDHLDDLFDMQDRIASQVAGAISPSIRASEIATARSLRPSDRGAYSLYMSALPHFWAHRGEENERAIELLSKALDQNPNEGRARALRGWCYAQQATYMWSDTPLLSRAAAIADAKQAAMELVDHAPSLLALSATFSMVTLDHKRARAILTRALSLDPNSAWGWMRSGWTWCYAGDPNRALEDFARAEDLSPRDPFLFNIHFGRGFAWGLIGEYDRAIELVNQGLTAGPGVTWAYRDLASFHSRAGHKDDADNAVRSLLQNYPNLTLKRVCDSMPPAVVAIHSDFLDGLRRAGVPDV